MENHHLMGKSTINEPFSIAVLNYQRVLPYTDIELCIHRVLSQFGIHA